MNDVTFARALSSVMLDNKYDRFVKNRRTGKLATKSLYKINTSSKLFKKREARKNKHYAVSLVVDCSGSMSGDKIKMASEAAEKLSFHLSKMDIPHNVVTFNLGMEERKPFDGKFDKDIKDKILSELGGGSFGDKYYYYAFYDTVKQVKSFSGKKTFHPFLGSARGNVEAKKMEGRLKDEGVIQQNFQGVGENSDAEALKFAREKILRQEGKKIMIFLSDGMPAPLWESYESPINKGYSQIDFDVKREADKTIAMGVELYAIGIMDDSVNKYYPPRRTCTINRIEQLYPHIIKLIRLNLKRG